MGQLKTFDEICEKEENGVDFWSATDLQRVLGCSGWDKFKLVIHKFVKACENSKKASPDYFSQVGKIVKTDLGVEHYISDYEKENFKI